MLRSVILNEEKRSEESCGHCGQEILRLTPQNDMLLHPEEEGVKA